MGRFIKLKSSIWSNPQWRQLTIEQQHLYFMMLSNPSISHAGVIDWIPKRFLQFVNNASNDYLQRACEGLVDAGFIIVDPNTDEALIRTYVKHSEILRNPKMGTAVSNAFFEISSFYLQDVLVGELLRLRESQPDLKGFNALVQVFELYRDNGDRRPVFIQQNHQSHYQCDYQSYYQSLYTQSSTLPMRSPIRTVITLPSGLAIPIIDVDIDVDNRLYISATKNDDASKSTQKVPKKPRRATQLPDDWKPNDKHAEIALTENVNLDEQHTLFTDWATAKGATFKDWDAAFRNWLRRANSFTPTKRETKTEQYQRLMTTAAAQSNGGGWNVS